MSSCWYWKTGKQWGRKCHQPQRNAMRCRSSIIGHHQPCYGVLFPAALGHQPLVRNASACRGVSASPKPPKSLQGPRNTASSFQPSSSSEQILCRSCLSAWRKCEERRAKRLLGCQVLLWLKHALFHTAWRACACYIKHGETFLRLANRRICAP